MSDPFAGLSFDPEQVRFEAAPEAMLDDLGIRSGQYWIFAKFDDKDEKGCQYLVLSGLRHVHSDVSGQETPLLAPDFGFVVRLAIGKAKSVGPADNLDGLGLPEHVVKGIASDAVARLLSAFGGREQLQTALDRQWKRDTQLIPPLAEAMKVMGMERVRPLNQ